MTAPATPGNFQVIRSEDRTSALCVWDSVQPYTVEQYLWFLDQWEKIVPLTNAQVYRKSTTFTGQYPAVYKVQVVTVAQDNMSCRVAIIKDDVVKAYRDIAFHANPINFSAFAVWDGLVAYMDASVDIPLPGDVTPPAVGETWQFNVYYKERLIPAVGADHYSLYQSERSNGLGFTVVAHVPNKASVPRQFTAVDNLDPDLLYSFQLTAGTTMAIESAPTTPVTDF